MQNSGSRDQNVIIIFLSMLLFVSFGVIMFLLVNPGLQETISPSVAVPDPRTSAPLPVSVSPTPGSAMVDISRRYLFAINTSSGAKVGEIGFFLKSVRRTKEIDVAGGRAMALSGRLLLIADIELSNSGNIPASVISRNYLRLKVNGQDRQLAPEYHSDPVDLQPQSSKDIRLGFNIAESDHSLILLVGELAGDKDIINLD